MPKEAGRLCLHLMRNIVYKVVYCTPLQDIKKAF